MAVGDIEGDRNCLAPVQREAHAWVRLLTSGNATETDASKLRQWCGQSPAHALAFSEASQLWEALGPAGQSLLAEAPAAAKAWRPRVWNRPAGRRALVGGALAASIAGLIAVEAPPFGLWPSLSELSADYRTGAGQQRSVVMSDGVAIRMNTKTSISVDAGGDSRAVELVSGEASFTTPGAPGKTFNVFAARGKASAGGASFDVRCLNDGARVTCLADGVQVEYRGRAVSLLPWQSITYDAAGLGEVVSADPEVVTAWQRGLLVFKAMPLTTVVQELNRYRSGRIVLMNAAAGQRLVDGRFRIDRPDEALAQIEHAFGVHGRTLPGGIVILS